MPYISPWKPSQYDACAAELSTNSMQHQSAADIASPVLTQCLWWYVRSGTPPRDAVLPCRQKCPEPNWVDPPAENEWLRGFSYRLWSTTQRQRTTCDPPLIPSLGTICLMSCFANEINDCLILYLLGSRINHHVSSAFLPQRAPRSRRVT